MQNFYTMQNYEQLSSCGTMIISCGMYRDWDDKPVERTPMSNPYSYDEYVIYQKQKEYGHSLYSDRLWQYDHKKYDELRQKHFGDTAQMWGQADPEKTQAFLTDYLDKKIDLVGIVEGCNSSNGYPYTVFFYNEIKE